MARMGSSTASRRGRRQFSEEFRAGAVARELDLTPSSLAKWVQQARADRSQGKTLGYDTPADRLATSVASTL